MKFSEKIFSLKNTADHMYKQVVFLGIKFRVERNDLRKNYEKVLSKIKSKNSYKVLFLVNDISKWKTQSLYDLMLKSENFEPQVVVTVGDRQWEMSKYEREKSFSDTYEYYKSLGLNCISGFDTNVDKTIDLSEFRPDIVFYQQPWRIAKNQRPSHSSKYCLSCYIPYFVPNYGILNMDCQYFHKSLFRYYVLNNDWADIYKKYLGKTCKNIKAVGHTMLDYFYLNKDKFDNEGYVIYAPHWSVFHLQNPNEQNYSTFLLNGEKILEYAKQHPEIKWAFKPHPTLKKILYKLDQWGVEKTENYYKQWEKIAKCCYDSEYMELFMKSKAMITDCGSFLVEYFCTGKPILHLLSPYCKNVPPLPAEKIFDTFYKVKNDNDLFKYLDDIIINNNDYKLNERAQLIKDSGLANNYAAKNVIEDLERVLCLEITE